MKRTVGLLLAALLGYPSASSALDLIGIYDMARASDPQIRQVRESMNATREVKPQARALLLPNLGIGGEYDWVDQHTTSSPLGRTGRNSLTQYEVAVQVSQVVYQRDLWISLL